MANIYVSKRHNRHNYAVEEAALSDKRENAALLWNSGQHEAAAKIYEKIPGLTPVEANG